MSLVTKTMKVADIKVGNRVRADLGDIEELAESIKAHGLLHPPTVDPTDTLSAGRRRLEAVKLLGWDTVEVRVAVDIADIRDVLAIERDENTCRKPFTPSEGVEMARRITAIEKPKAQQRQARPGKPRAARSEDSSERGTRTRDVAAAAAGMSHDTLRKATAVVVAATDETQPEPVRATAQLARVEMDETGNVAAAARRVNDAIADHIAENRPDLVEGQQGIDAAKAVRKFKAELRKLDPAKAARGNSALPQLDLHLTTVDALVDWLTTYRRNLVPLRIAEAQ